MTLQRASEDFPAQGHGGRWVWWISLLRRGSPLGGAVFLATGHSSLSCPEDLGQDLQCLSETDTLCFQKAPNSHSPAPSKSMCSHQTFNTWEAFCIFLNIFSFYNCISHHLLIWALLMLPVS